MDKPERLFAIFEDTIYEVDSYDDIKASINIQHGPEKWIEFLEDWYIGLGLTFRFDKGLQELVNIGAIKNQYHTYNWEDIHNSLLYIRSKIVKELGNGRLSNLNGEVERRWKFLEKEAEKMVDNKTLN